MKRKGCAMGILSGCGGCLGLIVAGGWVTGIWSLLWTWFGPDGAPDNVVKAPHILKARVVAFAPDGQIVVAENGDWDFLSLPDGKPHKKIVGVGGVPVQAAFSADGAFLTAIADEKTVIAWRISDGKRLATLSASPQTAQLRDVAISPDGKYVAASGWIESNLFVWRISDAKLIATRNDQAYRVLGWSRDGLLSAGSTFRMQNDELTTVRPLEKTLERLSASQVWPNWNGARVALENGEGLELINLQDGARHSWKLPNWGVTNVCWTPDQTRVALRFQTGNSVNGPHIRSFVEVRRATDGALLHFMQVGTSNDGTDTMGTDMTVSGDGKWLVITRRDGTLHLWDMSLWTTPIAQPPSPHEEGRKAQ